MVMGPTLPSPGSRQLRSHSVERLTSTTSRYHDAPIRGIPRVRNKPTSNTRIPRCPDTTRPNGRTNTTISPVPRCPDTATTAMPPISQCPDGTRTTTPQLFRVPAHAVQQFRSLVTLEAYFSFPCNSATVDVGTSSVTLPYRALIFPRNGACCAHKSLPDFGRLLH